MLILQRKAGESLVIGKNITVTVLAVDKVRVRLAISAPEDIPILRTELIKATAANLDSALNDDAPAELLGRLGDALIPADMQSEQTKHRKEELP